VAVHLSSPPSARIRLEDHTATFLQAELSGPEAIRKELFRRCSMADVRGGRISVGALCVLVLALVAEGQILNPSARDVLRQSRSLIEAEVALVLAAARVAVDGRTFRLSYEPGGPGADIQMESDGRPRYIRFTTGEQGHGDTVTFLHYTRIRARSCDGTAQPGDLILEYENKGAGWTVKARTRSIAELNDAAFDMLAGRRVVTAGPIQKLNNRTVRPFVAPFQLPDGALGGPPPGTTMALWLDIDSLVPVRWSVRLPVSPELGIPTGLPDFGLVFTYLDGVDLQPPTEIVAPDCVP
jgi:hypothetical protein